MSDHETKWQSLLSRIRKQLEAWRERLSEMDPAAVANWINTSQKNGAALLWGKATTIVLCTFFLSSIVGIFAGRYIPEPPAARVARGQGTGATRNPPNINDYNLIFARNLFNSQGIIPGEEGSAPSNDLQDPGGPPVRTSLPFNLIGTLILRDELRSIATIEDKSASTVYPVRIEDEIPSKAKILSIEASKVVFLNMSNGRREFVDLPEDLQGVNPRITLGGGPKAAGGGIEQKGENQFTISRAKIDKTMADLNSVLTQARAVPAFENGQMIGYKIFQIVPGSIYTDLGIGENDLLTMIDGEPLTDPARALGMLTALKEKNHVEISGKRGGRAFTNSYDIK